MNLKRIKKIAVNLGVNQIEFRRKRDGDNYFVLFLGSRLRTISHYRFHKEKGRFLMESSFDDSSKNDEAITKT